MRTPALACLLLAGALSAHAAAAPAVPDAVLATAAELRDRALAGNRAYDTVSSLVTEVGPRFAGTRGDAAAIAWAQRAMREAGFQEVRTEVVAVPRWVRGEAEVEITGPFPQRLVALALGGSVGTSADGIEAPVLMVEDVAALRELTEAEVSGRIVFLTRRMERLQDGSDYGRTVANRSQGPVEAARRGALALVIRSVGTSNARVAHTGGTSYAADVPRIPAVAISNPDADLLERQVATGRAVTLRMALSARELSPRRSANVIGEIPGRGPNADEIVLLGAHLDSWDITPGAHDDAAGVAIVMEAARQIAAQRRNPPRRTIRVVLFANEEFGLGGARDYAERHAADMQRHVIGLGADAGTGGAWRFDSGVDQSALPVIEAMARLLDPLGIPYGNNAATGIPDFIPLQPLGVPMLDIRQDMRPYFDVHHTINDTLDKIDPAELDRNVAAYTALLYVLAYTDVDFGWHPAYLGAPQLFDTLAAGQHTRGNAAPGHHLIRDQEAFDAAWARIGGMAPPVDFSRHAVLGLFMGERLTGSHSIEAAQVLRRGDTLRVTVRVQQPGPGCMTTQALTSPYQLVIVPAGATHAEFETQTVTTACD